VPDEAAVHGRPPARLGARHRLPFGIELEAARRRVRHAGAAPDAPLPPHPQLDQPPREDAAPRVAQVAGRLVEGGARRAAPLVHQLVGVIEGEHRQVLDARLHQQERRAGP